MGRLPITNAGDKGRFVTRIQFAIDRLTGEVMTSSASNVSVTRDVMPDAEVSNIIETYRAASAARADRVVGQITADLTRAATPAGEQSLGDVIADAQLAAAASVAMTGTTTTSSGSIACQQPGGIRANLLYARSGSETIDGQVTFAEIFAVHPFGNFLITISVTGAELEQMLEAQFRPNGNLILACSSTLQDTWDAAPPLGQRIDPTEIFVGGVPLDANATYRVTANNNLAEGLLEPWFSDGRDLAAGLIDVAALDRYFAARSPITPAPLPRIIRRN